MSDEDMGGDPACWSQLFEPDSETSAIDLADLALTAPGHGPLWTAATDDLNVNLLRFNQGEGVAEHINTEVDVLMIGIAGEGTVSINGAPNPIRTGQAVIIPKGALRATEAVSEFFAYLTCHRRRPGLMPKLRR